MNILLSCSGGFSSSIVVKNILKASEAQGKDNKVWTIDCGSLEDHVGNADVVMMAPQILHMKNNFEQLCSAHGIPVGMISFQDYGMANGEAVLKQAEDLVAEYKKNNS